MRIFKNKDINSYTFLSIVFILFCEACCFFSYAQSKSRVVLKDKTSLKDAKIHQILSNKIEYEVAGSLHDLLLEKIERIETDTAILSFDERGSMLSRPYDFLVKAGGDTIYGIIAQLGGNYIYYYPRGKDNRSYISVTTLKDYRKFEPQRVSKSEQNTAPPPPPQDSQKVKDFSAPQAVEIKSTTIVDSVPKSQDTVVHITLYEVKEEEKKPEMIPETTENEYSEYDESRLRQSVNNDLCYESYMKGVRDASQKDEFTWLAGGFCVTSCCGAAPLAGLIYWLLDKNETIPAPAEVDERCYKLGYGNQQKKNRLKQVATGGMAAGIFLIGAAAYMLALGGGI